jgi:hypothetical protein
MPTMQNVAPSEIHTPNDEQLTFYCWSAGQTIDAVNAGPGANAEGGPLQPINKTLQLGSCTIVIQNPA